MKQKVANRPDWARIVKKRYFQKYIRDDLFEGYISFLFLDQVKAPVNVRYGVRDVCIVDQKYTWLMFFPDNKQYSLTVMINSNNEIMQWYFDIVKSIQLTDEGIPIIEDLYLDLVVLPNGEYYLLDGDELNTALEDKEISIEDYTLAVEALEDLRISIERGENALINNTERYLALLKHYK